MVDETYDFPIPTVSGQAITVQWLQNDPRRIYRLLRTLVQQRLIGDKVLTGRVDLTGTGSALFEISESMFPDFSPSLVKPLSEYPLTTQTPGVISNVKPDKWGLGFEISDEEVAHNRIDIVMRNLVKIANQLIFTNDSQTLAAVASAVTQTQAATTIWTTTATALPFLDAQIAIATIDQLNQGYSADTIALAPLAYAYLVSSAAVIAGMPREDAANLISSGVMQRIGGLTFLKTTNMPSGVQGLVFDSTMLGSQAFEALGGGYIGVPGQVEYKRIRDDKRDGLRGQSRIVKAPMVQEPGAAVKLTGLTS